MDNLTHTMAGWVLGQTGLKMRSRKGLAALMLGANMPDIDVFFGWVPWEPLATHRGFTHSLVGGVVLMPPLLAGLLWLLDRWQVSRGRTFKSGLPMRFGWLVALSYLGALTHPLLDLQTTYSVQLLSPFSGAWFHSDSLFIIDLVLWIALAATLLWSKRREKRGGDWRRPAQAGLAVALAYIALNLVITQQAKAGLRARTGTEPAEAVFASPPPAAFWRRHLVWREGDCYRRSDYDPLGSGLGAVSRCQPSNMADPLVREAIRRDPRMRKFLNWSVMALAEVERGRCAAWVSLGDARYQRRRVRSPLRREAVVPIDGPGC